jgi:hypothetical protein
LVTGALERVAPVGGHDVVDEQEVAVGPAYGLAQQIEGDEHLLQVFLADLRPIAVEGVIGRPHARGRLFDQRLPALRPQALLVVVLRPDVVEPDRLAGQRMLDDAGGGVDGGETAVRLPAGL